MKGALRLNVEEWIKHLGATEETLRDIASTAMQHRSQFEQRLAVVASDKKEAREKLAAYLRGEQEKSTSAPPSEAWPNAQNSGETEKPQSDAEFVAAIEQLAWAHVEKVGDVRASALLSETGKRVTVPSYVFDKSAIGLKSKKKRRIRVVVDYCSGSDSIRQTIRMKEYTSRTSGPTTRST